MTDDKRELWLVVSPTFSLFLTLLLALLLVSSLSSPLLTWSLSLTVTGSRFFPTLTSSGHVSSVQCCGAGAGRMGRSQSRLDRFHNIASLSY